MFSGSQFIYINMMSGRMMCVQSIRTFVVQTRRCKPTAKPDWEKEREMIDVQNRIFKKFAVVDDYWRGCIYMYNCIQYWWFLGRMDASTILTNSWHRVGADDNVSYVSNFALVVKPIIHIELKSFTLNLRLIIFFSHENLGILLDFSIVLV